MTTTSYTVTANGPKDITGTSGKDTVTLAAGDVTVTTGAVETIIGSAAREQVNLGNGGETVSVSGIETVRGGNGADHVTVAAGATAFHGGLGADVINLLAGAGSDTIDFSSISDGSGAGANWGYDVVRGFEPGIDKVSVSGDLLSALDRLYGGTSLYGQVTKLSSPLADLTDWGFASFCAAVNYTWIGGMVMATNGIDTGLYLIGPSDPYVVTSNEVRLLAVFENALLSVSDLV